MSSFGIQNNAICSTTCWISNPEEIAEKALEDLDASRATLTDVVAQVKTTHAKIAGVVLRMLGEHYWCTERFESGLELIQRAAELDDGPASAYVACHAIVEKKTDSGTREAAFRVLEKLAESGDEISLGILASWFNYGLHVPQDRDKAANLYKKMFQGRDIVLINKDSKLFRGNEYVIRMTALGDWARLHARGSHGISKNVQEATRLLRLALRSDSDSRMNEEEEAEVLFGEERPFRMMFA